MSWGIVAVAGASLVGGAMSAKGSKDAARSQAGAAADATAAEREMLERQIELQEPWRQAGGSALNRLMYLSGLSPTGTFTPGQTPSMGGQPGTAPPVGGSAPGASGQPATAETRDQILARLSPKYVSKSASAAPSLGGGAEGEGAGMMPAPPGPLSSRLDEVALNAAVDAELAKQQRATQQQQTQANTAAAAAAAKDPAYGSLLNNFQMKDYTPAVFQQAGQYKPNTFQAKDFEMKDFTAKDFQVDPGYAFRQEEGERAIDRGAAAAGRFNSGRVLKDLTRFNSGLASQEYGNAYDRFNTNQLNRFAAHNANQGAQFSAFNANEGNRYAAYNTNEANRLNAFGLNEGNRQSAFNMNQTNQYNAFQSNQANQYNRLASLAGVGQTATNQMSGAAGAYGAAAGANAIGAGNARAAGQVGSANAINGAIGQGIGAYQQNQLMQQFARSGTSMYGAPANPYYAG